MQEIELKFQIPATSLSHIQAEFKQLSLGQDCDLVLRAAYFDTPDRLLGGARMALRVRQEGALWVQTLKAAGSNTMIRVEDNQPATPPESGQPILVDLSRHAGGPAQDALMRVLNWSPKHDPLGTQTDLIELYRTDITRTRVQVTIGEGTPYQGVVELALDLGHIHAGQLQTDVCELEIESISGSPMAVIMAGRDWVARHGLWLDTQTKAHRGDRLARQISAPVASKGLSERKTKNKTKHDITPAQRWRAAIENCLETITSNTSELASLEPTDTAALTCAWRRGLRHLRALCRNMDASTAPFSHEAMDKASQLLSQLDLICQTQSRADAISLAQSERSTGLCLDILSGLNGYAYRA
ncbi:MAG: CYTH domain-containing protein [Aquabacterium sp.]|nr:CYTH domain-containing protein [Aquabacterium sp.]